MKSGEANGCGWHTLTSDLLSVFFFLPLFFFFFLFHHPLPRPVSPFTILPGCFEPEQYEWIIEARTASSGYRLEVKSLRGMEAERHLEVCIPTMDFDIWPSPPGILLEQADFVHARSRINVKILYERRVIFFDLILQLD